jgi:hypothetical protein
LTARAFRTFPTPFVLLAFAIDVNTMRDLVAIRTVIPNIIIIIIGAMPVISFVIRGRRWPNHEITVIIPVTGVYTISTTNPITTAIPVAAIFNVKFCGRATDWTVIFIVFWIVVRCILLATATMPKFTFSMTTTTGIHSLVLLVEIALVKVRFYEI